MIKLDKLKPFTFYRLTSPIFMPTDNGDKKRGLYVRVLAPSIDDELRWLKNDAGINPICNASSLRLYKYFIEKYTKIKAYQQPLVKETNDADGKLTEKVVDAHLPNITEVTSFKEGLKNPPTRGYNTLIEINHITEKILNNPKDSRSPKLVFPNWINAITEYTKIDYFWKYFGNPKYGPDLTIFIPVNLWLKPEEYKNQKTFSPNSTSYFGHFVNWVTKTCTYNMGPLTNNVSVRVVLVNRNEVMVLSTTGEDIPDKDDPAFLGNKIKEFLRKCKSFAHMETKHEDKKEAEYVAAAESESNKEIAVDDAIEKYGIDQSKINHEQKQKLMAAVSKSVEIKNAEADAKPKPHDYIEPDDELPDHPEDDIGIFPSERKNTTHVTFDSELDSLMKDLKKDSSDIVVEARLAGQTVENYKRNQMLKEKYDTLKFSGETIEELAKKEEAIKLPELELKTKTINPNLNEIKSYSFEKQYNETLMNYDFARVLTHFSSAKPALYLTKDPEIVDISNETDRLYMVTVEYEDENRKRSKFRFKMPKMYQERYLFLNEQKWNIIHQKTSYPVTKTDPNLCQVATNYKKIRMSRFGNNVSSKITKLKKVLKAKTPKKCKITFGNGSATNNPANQLTTIEYDELGTDIYKLVAGNLTIYFSLAEAAVVCGNTIPQGIPSTCAPIGTFKRGSGKPETVYLDMMSNKCYIGTNESYELSDLIVNEISRADSDFAKEFADTSAGTKFMYTRAEILDESVPLVILLSAADPGGLQAVLDKAKINYQFYEKRPTDINKDNQGVVAFSDGYLVFDRYPYENSLLLNGLSAYPMKEISYYDMGTRDTFVGMFDVLYNRRALIDGIENFYYLLIDPITREILERLHQPTEFTELLLYANGLLADNTYKIESDYNQSRLRSNEIINVYLYQHLCDAYAAYKYGRATKFSIPEDCVIKSLMKAEIVDSHSKLNMTLEAENDRQVKLKGPGGLNVDRALTIEKRAYHPTMQGLIGINSVPSGEVGINRHMSLNSNIIDARGFLQVGKGDYDGTEIMTPGELMNTFACESADVERVAMAISQSKHLVPTASSGPSLVNYDMERVAPHMSNDFAFSAKKDGKVVDIQEDIMIIQYTDGTYDDIDLSYHADKNTDGGFFVMNQMESDLKPGDKFKKNEILAFDRKYVSPKDAFGDNAANIGTLARVAIVSNGGVFEDACYLTEKVAKRLASKITKEKIVTVSQYTNIKYIAKVGQQVKANDPILIFDDTQDEFTSQMLASMAAEAEDSDLINATTAPVVTKVSGVVSDIKIYYTVPIEDLSPSLQKIVKQYTNKTSARKKFIAKYIDPKDANTILAPSEQMIPDAVGRVSNIKVGDGVIIKIYVEYLDVLGVSDKITNYGALKGVVSFTIPEGQEAYTEDNPDDKIDVYLSSMSIYKRMSLDVVKVGGITKILVEKKRKLRQKYGEAVKAELRKK